MNNRLPNIKHKTKISVICEGPEEYDYMETLSRLKVWDEKDEFDLVNAGGNGSIPARYQDKYQNDTSDVVLIFCDTDKKLSIGAKRRIFCGDCQEFFDKKVGDFIKNGI